MGAPHCNAISYKNFLSAVKIRPKIVVFREYGGLNVKLLFSNPKMHILA